MSQNSSSELAEAVDARAAESGFSGAVRVESHGAVLLEKAYGLADRRLGVANTVDTQFAVASGSKVFTALAVMSLVADGTLTLDTPARKYLGDDLPLIRDDVTVEHLLAHRAGIGDYLAEDDDWDPTAYVLPIPVHRLATTEDFLAVLDGFPTVRPPGEAFSYCNGGYIVLALIAERASGIAYHDLVAMRVTEPAGMTDTAFLRSDELPTRAATGYLTTDSPRSNIFHLPVRGNGDGGAYATLADWSSFWAALLAGRILDRRWVNEMIRPHSVVEEEDERYGLGFLLHMRTNAMSLVGMDAGVSFCTVHDPDEEITHTVMSNSTDGVWPVNRLLMERLTPWRTPA